MDKLLYFSRLYHYITVNMSSYKTNEIEEKQLGDWKEKDFIYMEKKEQYLKDH